MPNKLLTPFVFSYWKIFATRRKIAYKKKKRGNGGNRKKRSCDPWWNVGPRMKKKNLHRESMVILWYLTGRAWPTEQPGCTAPRSCNKNPIAGPSNESTRFHDLRRRIPRFIRLFLLFRGKEPDLRIFLPGMERAKNTDTRMARSKFRRVSWLSSFVYR